MSTGAEQRSYTRIRVRVHARTRGDGAISRRVEIRDVAVGGLYIAALLRAEEHAPPHAGLAAADGLVHVEFIAPAGFQQASNNNTKEALIRFTGRPVRMTARGFGLAFADDESALVRDLIAALVGESDAHAATQALQRRSEPATPADAALIDSVKDAVAEWVPGAVRRFADQAEARLVARAGKSHSNAEQTPFFDAIAELKRWTAGLDSTIVDVVSDGLEHLGQPKSEPSLHGDEFALVEKDKFEIYLTVAAMATKAEHRFDYVLYRVGSFLGAAVDVVVDTDNNPLGPGCFADAFHDYISDAPLTLDAMSVIYQCFEDLLISDLNELYLDVLQVFEKAGVAPSKAPQKTIAAPKPSLPEPVSTASFEAPDEPEPGLDGPESFLHRVSDDEMLEVPSGSVIPAAAGGAGANPNVGADRTDPFTSSPTNPFDQLIPASTAGTGEWQTSSGQWFANEELSLLEQLSDSPEPNAEPRQANQRQTIPRQVNTGVAPAPTAIPYQAASERPGSAQGSSAFDAIVPAPTPGMANVGSEHQGVDLPGAANDSLLSLVPDLVPGGAGGSLFDANQNPSAGAGRVVRIGGNRVAQTFAPRVIQPMRNYALPAARAGSAFGAAQSLLGLTRGLSGTQVAEAQSFELTSESLLATLEQLQRLAEEQGRGSFRANLRDALGFEPGVDVQRHGQLGDAVELIGCLFDGMRADTEIRPEMRARLYDLEPVVHKVALLDPTFFELSEHPARQILNQMARLAPELEPDELSDGEFWDGVDQLLQPLVDSFDRDMSLFDAVLSELDLIVEGQQTIYRANLDGVVNASEAQAQFIRERRNRNQGETTSIPEPTERGTTKEWTVWLNRAARLEAGETIELNAGANNERLRIAWIGDNHSSFVLANGRGHKQQTLSRQELAMRLRRGTASIVREFELPLVDRALSRVLEDMHGTVERHATRDTPTGLLNRRTFIAQLASALAHNSGEGKGVGVLFFSVDEYQQVRDEYGEDAGDILMRRVARGAATALGDRKRLATLEPGSVASFQMDCDLDDVRTIAQQICDSVNKMKVRWGDLQLTVKVRVGGVLCPAGEDAEDAVEAAARALGDGTDGASTIQVESRLGKSGADGELMEYVTLITRLLSQDELQLRCQRIVPMRAGRRVKSHFEVLLGVRDDEGKPIPAQDLIRAAEHYNQMPALDRWVLRNVMQWMAKHRRWLRHVGGFSINLSPASFEDEHLVEFVLELLNETGVPPGKLIFEITETVAADESGHARKFLRTLSEVGCQFALDDFGAGRGSHDCLKQLLVNYVKIDGAFIRNVATNNADLAVVQSINEVANFMGKKTIAKQVDSEDALTKLREVGVDFVQGFHVDEPVYFEAITEDFMKADPDGITVAAEAIDQGKERMAIDRSERTLDY
jgi:diguanylate cyclase (GGDEF)-like protein